MPNSVNTASGCACWIPRDSSWRVAQFDGSGGSGGPGLPPDYRNDDWVYCLEFPSRFHSVLRTTSKLYVYQQQGNVSIDNPYATFTAIHFLIQSYNDRSFWGDVDTRGALSGIVISSGHQYTPDCSMGKCRIL
ncbi:MAG: hypothetical protein IPI10_19155 [Bacteroidetes bacterium]|nr:hypothetical protein [Bacteroidota bacterium]